MSKFALVLGALTFAAPAVAQVPVFPASFRTQQVTTNGVNIHVRIGGQGPAVVLLHGYGETGDMWAPMAADLSRDHTVVVPDLRGLPVRQRRRVGGANGRFVLSYAAADRCHDAVGGAPHP